jgi:hypothetical protein
VNAGSPPSGDDVVSKVSGLEKRKLSEEGVESLEKLAGDKRKKVDDELVKQRLGVYGETAKKISIYASMSAFGVPGEDDPSMATPLKDLKETDAQDRLLYDLQWQYWIASDVLRAMKAANGSGDRSVLRNPVKRLISLRVLPMEVAAAASSSGEAMSMGGGDPSAEAPAAPVDGGATAAPEAADSTAALAVGEPAIDDTIEIGRDYAKRHTGRVSNTVFDVRMAEVVFVAETSKLPLVFEKFADQNFMTITNLKIAPADPFGAARLGYLYGSEPVCEVTATVETIWFRKWTAKHMPAVLRTALGIQSAAPAVEGAAGGSTESSGF